MNARLFLACLLAAPSVWAAEPIQVEDRGEPRQFHYQGHATFDAKQLAQALEADVDFLLAAHPRASFPPMLRMLEEKLTRGYQHGGFPQATVSANWDDKEQRVNVQISEGPRYRAGPVEVQGAKQSDPQKLAHWITLARLPEKPAGGSPDKSDGDAAHKTSQPEKDDLQWKAGEPVTFVPWAWTKFEKRVRSGLAAQGFHFPKFKVEVSPKVKKQDGQQDNLATLVVSLQSEGPVATIGRIEVTGSRRYPPDEILTYLGLQTPLTFDAELESRLNEKLRSCGRFLFHEVKLSPPTDEQGQMTMHVRLRDNVDGVPPLEGKFSREEQALLRMAKWFEQWAAADEDLVLRSTGPLQADKIDFQATLDFEAVVSLRHGAYLRYQVAGDFAGGQVEQEMLLSGDQFIMASPRRRAALVMPNVLPQKNHDTSFKAQVAFLGLETEGKTGSQITTNFSVNMENHAPPEARLVELQLGYAPAAALYAAHMPDWRCEFDGPLLRLSRDTSVVEIDETTGRLERLQLIDRDKNSELTIRVARGAFHQREQQVQSRVRDYANGWRAEAPLASLTAFALDEYRFACQNTWSDAERARLGAVQRLLQRVCRSGDAWLTSPSAFQPKDSFKLPPPDAAAAQGWQQMITGPLLQAANFCFPRECPPWTLSRETAFLMAGKGAYAQREISGLLNSPSAGPISGLYAAGLFRWINADLSRGFARQSLFRTDVRFFRRDLEWLLAPGSAARAPLLDAAETLRQFEPAELQAMAALMTQDNAQQDAVAAALLQLKAADPHSAEAALPTTLEDIWQAILQQHVERWLNMLSQHGLVRST